MAQPSIMRDQDRKQENQLRIDVPHPEKEGATFEQVKKFIHEAKLNYEHKVKKEDIPSFDDKAIYIKPREAGRSTKEEKIPNPMGGIDSILLDLVFMSDGSTVQVMYQRKPDDKNNKNPKNKGGNSFSIDMTQFGDPNDPKNVVGRERGKLALAAFSNMIIEAELRFHPHNRQLNLFGSGSSAWASISDDIMRQRMQANLYRFEAKGIQVFINGIQILNPAMSIGLSSTPKKQTQYDPFEIGEKGPKKSKPWDVPKVPKPPGSTQ